VQYVEVTPVVVTVVLAGALALAAGLIRARRHGAAGGWTAAGVVLLVGAVATTLVVTLGPVETLGSSGPSANLVPFRDIRAVLRSGNASLILLNLAGNALLFAPVGFLLALVLRRPLTGLLLGVLLSVFEESLQYVAGRAADVDDVILNGVGVGVGVLAAVAVRAFVRAEHRDDASSRPRGGARGPG
jgi:glycopeptide antibiotics resistance protein